MKQVFVDAPLVWIDAEMTGLDINHDKLLEVAVVLTDSNLEIIAEGPNLVIWESKETLDKMNDVVMQMHTSSGLYNKVLDSTVTLSEAQAEIKKFLKRYCVKGESPLCGNSVWQDKIFLNKYMPEVMDFLHYRIIDVSTLKELIRRWYPDSDKKKMEKNNNHRALDDIYESIEELRWYRKHFFIANK